MSKVVVSWESGMVEEFEAEQDFMDSIDGTEYYVRGLLSKRPEIEIYENDSTGEPHPVGLAHLVRD